LLPLGVDQQFLAPRPHLVSDGDSLAACALFGQLEVLRLSLQFGFAFARGAFRIADGVVALPHRLFALLDALFPLEQHAFAVVAGLAEGLGMCLGRRGFGQL
jgi:hypothetical protein